jgi:heme-degrading monooxygenase HmoA
MKRTAVRTASVVMVALGILLASNHVASAPKGPSSGKAIARVWRGRTLQSKADAYEAYLNQAGVSKIRATPGNLGVYVMRRTEKDQAEFVVLSLWESLAAVQKFAGADYQKAVILPRDREYLIEVEPNVLHYDVVRSEVDR